MNLSDRELWLLQAAINRECIKLLKRKEIHCINSSFIHLVDRIADDKPLFYHKIRHSNVFLSDKWQVVNY